MKKFFAFALFAFAALTFVGCGSDDSPKNPENNQEQNGNNQNNKDEDNKAENGQNASATDLLNKLSAGTCSFNGGAATPMSGHYYSNEAANYIDASSESGVFVRMDLGKDHTGTPIDFTSLTSSHNGQVYVSIGMQDPKTQNYTHIFTYAMNEGQYCMSLDGETEYPFSEDASKPTEVAAKSGFLKATQNGSNIDMEIAVVLKSGNTFACKFTARYTELN